MKRKRGTVAQREVARRRQERNQPLRRFIAPGILLLVVLVYGTLGYRLLQGWTWLDSFYMTLNVISTVGLGEVHPLGPAGRIFTSTLLIGGAGTMLYAFGLFAETLSAGHFLEYRRRRLVEQTLKGMTGHYIICGFGRIGSEVAQEFETAGEDQVVIETDPELIENLAKTGILHINGDASTEVVLREAGIERAKGLICAVDSDELGIYIVLIARAVSPDLYIVARASRQESVRRMELAGANRVVSPYVMAGHRMAEMVLNPSMAEGFDTVQHGGSEIAVKEFTVNPRTAAIGQTLKATGLADGGADILALRRRDGELLRAPELDIELEDGDLLIALGTTAQLSALGRILK